MTPPLFRAAWRLALPVAALAAVFSGCAPHDSSATGAAVARPANLEIVSAYQQNAPGLGDPITWISTDVGAMSDQRLTLTVKWPGEVLSSPSEILDAVSAGKVDAGYSSAGFWSGKMPAAPIFSAIPFGPDAPEYLAWLYYGRRDGSPTGMDLYQQMYDDAGYHVKVLVAAISTPETAGWYRKPIETPADLQGMKMRVFGFGGSTLQALGVAVNQLPGGEIYQALDTGAIDAAEYSTPAVDADMGFYKVAPYNYFPGWHQQTTVLELLINRDSWDALSPGQRAMIEAACLASVTKSLAYSEAIQPAAMQANVEKHGVKVMIWSPEMLATFERTWLQVADEKAATDPFFNTCWRNLRSFRDDYRLWSEHGFMPRNCDAAAAK